MTHVEPIRVGGMVLCGGASARMGRPKAWLEVGGETLLARVVRILGEVTRPIVVVAAPGQEVPMLPPEVVIARDAVGGGGPLQGIAAGMAALAGWCDAVFVSACDVPWLRTIFVQRMIDLLGPSDAAVPVIDGQPYPLSALYHLRLAPLITQLLSDDRRSPRVILERANCRAVGRDDLADVDPALVSLRDITTPEDYGSVSFEG